ncbi:S-layer homology domain-containing protein [Paenibacillus filicis]|uniref:S-layer homology domain-containing protein n=1 Tax=Paenibacillus gyeongsangnamensis TaxID=3388067 RepID=A0ABT4Q475_9BACL|nr:S-layer homology domain-containing protein [Paenibacillus filicis]MCZ8511685.1 S-layer homology domain-containing protein [Paenibacillus filicis]
MKLKKLMYQPSLLLILLLFSFTFVYTIPVFAETQSEKTIKDNILDSSSSHFTDLHKQHWAYNTIIWAIDQKIISGYEDNTIRPDKSLTGAEFLAMIQRDFPNSASTEGNPYTPAKWYDEYYRFANNLNLPVTRNEAESDITRGKVAQIIAYGLGQRLDIKGSVNYLLDKKLSNGKTAPTYEGFKANDVLTRAECLAFIKNLLDKGITSLQKGPLETSVEKSSTRTYTNTRFGFSINFPTIWPKEDLLQNGDGAVTTGPPNGEYGEFAAAEYTFTVSGHHYIEKVDQDGLYTQPDGPYKNNHYSTISTMNLNDGTKAKLLIISDSFPTQIQAEIIQDNIVYTMSGSIGVHDYENYEKVKEEILNTIKSFHLH